MGKNLDYKSVAVFVALASVLQMSESLIPSPVPGLKPGLANMISLVILVLYGFKPALQVSFFRTLLSSLVTGSFLSPGFLLSMSSALLSTLVMQLFLMVIRQLPFRSMSLIGISVAGAITHSYVQLFMAYFFFIHHLAVFSFLPWLLSGAVIMGWINGKLAILLCQKIEKENSLEENGWREFPLYSGNYSLRELKFPLLKIVFFLFTAVAVFAADQSWILVSLLGLMVLLFALRGIPVKSLFKTARRYVFFLTLIFCFPLFFEFRILGMELKSAGVFYFVLQYSGFVYALKLLVLILSSSWIIQTTSSEALGQTVSLLFSPLKYLGMDEKKLTAIFMFSWELFPLLLKEARQTLSGFKMKEIRGVSSLVEQAANLIYSLLYKFKFQNKEGGV